MLNYHKHTSYSTCFAPFKDSLASYKDYAERAVQLGHRVLTSVEHGFQGDWMKCYSVAEQYNLKYVFGVEAYFVADRKAQDDRNAHIILLAKNMEGIRSINRALAEANRTGFYRVPRVDMELLSRMSPADVFVTTACVAHWGRVDKETRRLVMDPDAMRTFRFLVEHFTPSSLRLEVQSHNTDWQKEVNSLCQRLSYEYHIPLIAGLDSHYIFPEGFQERKYLREESGVHMKDEDHEIDAAVYEDYPDDETCLERFRAQGVLTEDEVQSAMAATDEILDFDDIILSRERKLPTIYQKLSQEERNELYLSRVDEGWKNYRKDVPKERWDEYEEAIIYETDIVTSTGVADYFLIDYAFVKLAKEKYGGVITPTGRGSGGGFFTNTLLGFSTLDRLDLPVKLYPERFVTADRLKTSLPDLDLNVADPAPFIKAQEEVMGKGHAYPMISYGTLKTKSAFKLYARVSGIPAETANAISQQIERYEIAVKNAEDDDKDAIDIAEYVDAKYIPYIEKSEPYRGIVVSRSQAPCGFLLYDGDIEADVGIVRVNTGKGGTVYCTVCDGYCLEAFGYVKNDLLTVNVVAVNARAMELAKLKPITSKQLISLISGDSATWDIFAKGYTCGINQCQGEATTQKLKQYKPRELRDLAAFVAGIRPGFKSQLPAFLRREKFSYYIPPFDGVLHNDSSGSSWMLYQENSMTALNMAGFSLERTYPIIKAISKKKKAVIDAAKDEFLPGFAEYTRKESPNISEEEALRQASIVWKVIEDSSSYSFNASHAVAVALDALYGAYLKAHYPLAYYTALLENYAAKGDTAKVADIKQEMRAAFGIRIAPCRFRQDNRAYLFDEKERTITDVLHAMKGVGKKVSQRLYEMRGDHWPTFTDMLVTMRGDSVFSATNIVPLIRSGYFEEYGSSERLLAVWNAFYEGPIHYDPKYVEATREKRLTALRELEAATPDTEPDPLSQIRFEAETYGAPFSTYKTPRTKCCYAVLDVVARKGSPKLTLYSISTGNVATVKVRKGEFDGEPLAPGDIIRPAAWKEKPLSRMIDGKWTPIPGTKELWFYDYLKMEA